MNLMVDNIVLLEEDTSDLMIAFGQSTSDVPRRRRKIRVIPWRTFTGIYKRPTTKVALLLKAYEDEDDLLRHAVLVGRMT